jgi:hypothetical protein
MEKAQMKRMLMLLTLALAVFGVLAQAEVVQNQTTTTTVVLTNACTLENVDFTVTYHYIYNVTVNGNMAQIGMHINMAGTGVGEISGANYTINATDKMDLNVGVGTDETFMHHVNVVGQGNVPNFKSDFTMRVKLDANGNVTTFLVNTAQTCQ